MAIIDLYEASISTAEDLLPEFDDPDAEVDPLEATKLVRYLKAEPDASFTIHFKLRSGFKFRRREYMGIHVYLDGKILSRPVLHEHSARDKSGCLSHHLDGVVEGYRSGWTKRKFKFGGLKLSEEDIQGLGKRAMAKYASLGDIKIEFWRMKGGLVKNGILPAPVRLTATGAVPEKALKGKAVDLRAGLDEAEVTTPRSLWEGRNIDSHPVATFVFKYRGEEALKQLGIIERSPSPIPLEDRSIDELTLEETRELLRRQRAEMEAVAAKIKKERAQTNGEKAMNLKRERGDDGDGDADSDGEDEVTLVPGPKKQRPNPADVIDLSMDD